MASTTPSFTRASISTSPAGDSSVKCWVPSCFATMPDSSTAVAVQMVLEPE